MKLDFYLKMENVETVYMHNEKKNQLKWWKLISKKICDGYAPSSNCLTMSLRFILIVTK